MDFITYDPINDHIRINMRTTDESKFVAFRSAD